MKKAKAKRAGRLTVASVERRISQALKHWMKKNPGKPGSAFARCVESVAARGGAVSPRAVCAAAGRKKYGKRKFQEMAAAGRKRALKRGKRNPADQAAAVYKEFHGRPATREKVVEVKQHVHTKLAELGKLLRLKIRIPGVGKFLLEPKGVLVTTSEDKEQGRRQIYFTGGDQRLERSMFPGFTDPWKDHVDLGVLTNIAYLTKKGFHNFEAIDYRHRFGTRDGGRVKIKRTKLPSFHYDTRSELFYISGGTYSVERDGIVG